MLITTSAVAARHSGHSIGVTSPRVRPSCAFRVLRWETAAVVRLSGVVDLATAPLVRAVLHDLLDDVALIFVDLYGVTLIDGHSVGMLVSTHRRAGKTGTALWLRAARGRVRRVLEITGAAKLCDPPDVEMPAGPGEVRTAETLLRARRACGTGRGADDAREGLRQLAIAEMYDLAVGLARNYRGRGEATEDLVQVALVGLIKAVDRFDADLGPGFTAFAVPTIAGELKRHFRDKGWMIRVPRRMQDVGAALAAGREALSQRLRRPPTVDELAAHLGTTPDEVIEAMDAAQAYRPGSLSAPITGIDADDGPELGDVLGDPDPGFELVENRESLRDLIRQLPCRQRRILALRFYGDLTQSQIAEKVGVSQMHVSRLLSAALQQLRSGLMGDAQGPDRRRPA
jgi:RNA polymerase sigma-B factor